MTAVPNCGIALSPGLDVHICGKAFCVMCMVKWGSEDHTKYVDHLDKQTDDKILTNNVGQSRYDGVQKVQLLSSIVSLRISFAHYVSMA